MTTGPPFEIIGQEDVLHTWHFTVRRVSLRTDSGDELTRDLEVHRGSAACVAFDPAGRMALVRQYRLPLQRWTLELPTGGVEDGESPAEAAIRELQEEVGLVPLGWEPLVRFANSPGHSTQWTDVFLATDCREGTRAPQGLEEESMRVVMVDLDEAVRLVRDGEVVDAKSILGIQAAAARLHGGLRWRP